MAQKKTNEIKYLDFPEKYKVLGADLSLRRPGWALIEIENGKIKGVELYSIDNKTAKTKTHNQILREIAGLFNDIMNKLVEIDNPLSCTPFFLVREKMIMNMKVPSERDVAKVVGVMDLLADNWNEIYPVTVKKLITGFGKAEKSEVAKALEEYVGKQNYKCDDESDATAVAIAWLIQQKQLEDKHG